MSHCAACETLLERWEEAQPMRIGQHVFRPRSFCTACTRAGAWEPGSAAALARLTDGSGAVDVEEAARVAEATAAWLPLFAGTAAAPPATPEPSQ